MKYLILIIVSILLMFESSCKKKSKDTITNQNISGMVFNNCTDSGLAGVTVYLRINKDNQAIRSYEAVSGVNGAFNFPNVEIHSNTEYSYLIYIESQSGTSAQLPSQTRFDGASLSFSAAEANKYFIPRVTPGFFRLCYSSNINFPFSQPDSINIHFEQKTFHKNVANLPYSGSITNQSNLNSCSANYPMGKWNFKIDKWKNGIHTTTYDSLYIGWAASGTYVVN